MQQTPSPALTPFLAAALAFATQVAVAQPATPPADRPGAGGMHGAMHGGGAGHPMHGDDATARDAPAGRHGGGMHGGGMHGGEGGGMHGAGMHGGGMHGGGLGGPTHLGRVFEHALRDAQPTDEQRRQVDRVVEATRKKNWPLFDQMLEEGARLKALHAAQPRDLKAIKATYRKLADVRVRIAENRLDAFEEVGRLLTPEQRTAFEAHLARHFSH